MAGTQEHEFALLHERAERAMAAGDRAEALACLRRAAELAPDSFETFNNLGGLEEESGNLERAVACYERATQLAPASAVPAANLGIARARQGKWQSAVQALRVAATLDPGLAEAWLRLGEALIQSGLPDAALGPLRRAAELVPGDGRVQRLLGDALQFAGDLAGAIPCYERALVLDDQDAEGWYGLAHAHLDLGRHAEAAASLERCVALAPDDGRARCDLGKALQDLGEIERAMPELRTALASDLPEVREQAARSLATIVPGSPDDDNASVRDTRRGFAQALPRRERPAARTRASGDRLRVGYLSSFFDRANWMKPVWGLLNRHDRARFEICLYCDTPGARIDASYEPQPADRVFNIAGADNEAVARAIAECDLDLLVDLNGYSRPERLGVFALRPARHNVGWFNYYATSGSAAFDYLIGDAQVIPPEEEACYGERILRVPGSYLTFSVEYDVPDVVAPPCRRGAPFTFGSLASQYKLTDQVLDTWAELLGRTPDARLLLRNATLDDPGNRAHLVERLGRRGVAAERLILEGGAPHHAFLQTYDRIDVALDTFPYNGGTTTTEALWQGVPVVSFAGDRWASRTSASILRAGGQGDWVAADRAGYVETAARLAADPAALAETRAGLRERLRASPVCATEPFARAVESLYEQIASQ